MHPSSYAKPYRVPGTGFLPSNEIHITPLQWNMCMRCEMRVASCERIHILFFSLIFCFVFAFIVVECAGAVVVDISSFTFSAFYTIQSGQAKPMMPFRSSYALFHIRHSFNPSLLVLFLLLCFSVHFVFNPV